MTKAELIAEVEANVLTGGNRTTAANTRQVLIDMINNLGAGANPVKNITAKAGGGQALATALTGSANRVDTCATDGDSVKIQAGTTDAGSVMVQNKGAATLYIYPQSGENFYGMAANAYFELPSGGQATFLCYTTGEWTLI